MVQESGDKQAVSTSESGLLQLYFLVPAWDADCIGLLPRSQVFPSIPSHSLPIFFSLVQRDLSLAMDPSHITEHITITWKKKEKHRKHTRN